MGAYGSKKFKADLQALKSNDPTLQSLNYEQAGLGDDGARALADSLRANRTLRKLQLGQCSIGAVGVRSLVQSLCDNSIVPCHIRRLELSTSSAPPLGNPIGDNGAKCLAFLLVKAVSLRHLTAANCGIGDEGAVSIAQALAVNKSLRTLDLSYNSISDIGVEQLGSALSTNHTLQGLSLWQNRVFHSGAEALANGLASNDTLQWLGLGCNHIGDEGAKAIAIALLTNARESKLVWLALGGNQITDRGVEHLAVSLKAQSAGRPAASSAVEMEGDAQSQASLLTEQIRSGGLQSMLEMGVTPSHLSMAVGEEGERGEDWEGEDEEEGSPYCIPLESLGLGGNQITDLGAVSLAEGLVSNTRLLSLGLADNRISDDGASSLADLLRQTDCLQRLVLSGNDIHDEGGSKLVAALSQNRSLKGLYLAGNPVGDSVGERCREVVGKYNVTLEALDVHNTPMSTPAVSTLVDTMRKEGVLRILGSQPVPQPGTKSSIIPTSGNILELEQWRPLSQEMPLIQPRQTKMFSSTTSSQRQTTIEALGSLPPPEETAQVLVVRAGQEEPKLKRRHGSISEFFGRVSRKGSRIFSRKDSVGPTEQTAEQQRATRRQSRRAKTSSAIELQPLVEEDDDGGEMFGPLRTPTMVVMDTPMDGEREERLPSYDQELDASYDRELDVVEPTSSLHSLTKGRPRPPPNRRPPSRERSPRHSPRASAGVERIGGITRSVVAREEEEEEERFTYDVANRMLASAKPIVNSQDPSVRLRKPSGQDEKPLKRQWSVALKMRVGMLKMGGFLHSGFDAVTAADSTLTHTYIHAKLPRNLPKNRQDAPLPPSHTRVKLQLVFEEVGSDYINASFVGSPSYPKSYIVTQAPLEDTVCDFWRMVWENRVSVIVVLTQEHEDEAYWPDVGESDAHPLVVSSSWVPDALIVTNDGETAGGDIPGLLVRQLTIQSTVDRDGDRVQMFHYQDWPQHGVSESPGDVARLFHQVTKARQRQQVDSPLLVVSQLGAGRAGCFCAVGVAYELMRSPHDNPNCWEPESNILDQVIRGLRHCRSGLVGTQQQFEFCHCMLGEVLSGRLEGEEGTDAPGQQRTGWRRIFGGRKKKSSQSNHGVGRQKATPPRRKNAVPPHVLLEEEDPTIIEDQLLY